MGTLAKSYALRTRRALPELPIRGPGQGRTCPQWAQARSSPEGAADPSGPAHAGSSPGRAQRVQGAPCAAAGTLDHGHPAQDHRPRCRRSAPGHPQFSTIKYRTKSCFSPYKRLFQTVQKVAPNRTKGCFKRPIHYKKVFKVL